MSLNINHVANTIFTSGTNSSVSYGAIDNSTVTWDLSTSPRYNFQNDGTPNGIAFKPDGTIMYVVGASTNRVFQLPLSTAWASNTATNTAAFSVQSQDSSAQDLVFKSDGTQMYVLGQTNKKIFQYNLATPWDVNTATFITNSNTASIQLQDSTPTGLAFKPDGTLMYVTGSSNDAIYMYTLSTPWSVNTAAYTLTSPSIATLEASSQAIQFDTTGNKMWITGSSIKNIIEFSLPTAWNVSTFNVRTRKNIVWDETTPTGMYYADSANTMFVVGQSIQLVNSYLTNKTASEIVANNLVLTGNTTANGSLFVTGNMKVDGGSFYVGGATFAGGVTSSSTLTGSSTISLTSGTTGTVSLGTSVTTGGIIQIGTSATTAPFLYGGTTQTGNTTFARSTLTSNVAIANGATVNANTKTLDLATNGVLGSSTIVNIGPAITGANGIINVLPQTRLYVQNTSALAVNIAGSLVVSNDIVQNGISQNITIVRNSAKGTFANLDNISTTVNTAGYPLVSTVTGSQAVFWSWEQLKSGITAGTFTGTTLTTTPVAIGNPTAMGSGGDTIEVNLYEQSGNNFYRITYYQMVTAGNAAIFIERLG